MPSSHLPRAPCDNWVYHFPYDFRGIVCGYGLRRICSHCLWPSCDFSCVAGRGKAVERLCGHCIEIVQLPCHLRSLRTGIFATITGLQILLLARSYESREGTLSPSLPFAISLSISHPLTLTISLSHPLTLLFRLSSGYFLLVHVHHFYRRCRWYVSHQAANI